MNVIVELGAGGEVLNVLPDALTVPSGAQRVTAEEGMLRRVDALSFLSVASGALVLDEAAQQAARDQAAAALNALRADALARDLTGRLRTATPAQIDTWVDAQVTDLASARTMFKRILLVLAAMARTQ